MKKGYTLIELVVVITILVILGFIVIPRYAGYSSSILERDAQKLKSYLLYAQELAMIKNEPYGLCFNTSSRTFSVNKTDCSSSNIITSPENRGEELVVHLDCSISISPSGTTSIFFTKKGEPDPDGITITLTYNSNSRVIKVEPKTGFVYE